MRSDLNLAHRRIQSSTQIPRKESTPRPDEPCMRARHSHGTAHRPLRPLPASRRLIEAEAATSSVTEPARAACVVGLAGEHPEPELSFGARLDAQGVSEVRAGARGAPAIVAMVRVLIVLFIVAGAVVIAMELRTPREGPRRQGPCTERIERTEYIERMCARNSP
jgi:hypothetical protein